MKHLIYFSILILLGCSGNKRMAAPIYLDVLGTKNEILSKSTASDTLVVYSSGGANCPTNQGGSVIYFRKFGVTTYAVLYTDNNRIDTMVRPWNFPWRYISENWNQLKLDSNDYTFQELSHYKYDELFIQFGSDTLTSYIEMAAWQANKGGAKVILNEKIQAMLYRVWK